MIGIIGAMDIEVQGLKDRMKNLVTETVGSIEFSTGILHGVECVVAVSYTHLGWITSFLWRPKQSERLF